MQAIEVFLNRFLLRSLDREESFPWLLQVHLDPPPEPEAIHALLGRLARQAGPMVARLGTGLVSWSPPEGLALEGEVAGSEGAHAYRLLPQDRHPLDPARPGDREALNALARRRLELGLRQAFPTGYRAEGRRLLSLKPLREGPGWRLLRGAELDPVVHPEGRWLLEVDLVHRLEATLDLEGWLAQGHPLPARARNAYGGGYRGVWEVLRLGEEDPEEVLLENGLSLLAYHRQRGHWSGGPPGRVVWVRDPRRARETPHLTGLLVPVLTLEELEEPLALQIPPESRRKDAEQVARVVAQRLFGLPEARPLRVQAQRLPQARLRAHGGKRVGKPADALRVGALGAREATVALLRLDGGQGWPPFLREALEGVARASGVSMGFLSGQTPPPERELAFRQALAGIRAQGAEALLVLTPPLTWERRNRIKALALQEGLPTQLLNTPIGPGEQHRMANALLGLLAKLGWPVVALEGRYPAELVVGFDAGGRDTLRFGGAACATTGDGSFLGWALPEAQVGERIPEWVAWDLLADTLKGFHDLHGRFPRRVLLLRDGRIPQGEFRLALEGLRQEGIAYDLLSVRKSGGGRIYPVQGRLGDGIFLPLEGESFLLLTVHREGRGTPRPLKVVREVGETPLEEVARQVYHLTRLYPPSGFLFPRLPAPLHLADRLVKERARIGSFAQGRIPPSSLFFV